MVLIMRKNNTVILLLLIVAACTLVDLFLGIKFQNENQKHADTELRILLEELDRKPNSSNCQ